ncbi:MAG: glycosyltransferase [Syntrophobacteraceae bacterium]
MYGLYIVLPLCFLLLGLLAAVMRWRRLASTQSRVLLTGGGTGGHVNPALAIAEGIRKKEPETKFLYVGVKGKAETVIVRRAGYTLRFVSSEGFPGLRPSLRSLRFCFRLGFGVLQSFWILLRFAPNRVIATGGYVSAPIILATLILRVLRISPTKIFLHEQNSIPGQLNAFLGRWVDRVLLTFPQTLSFFPKNGVVVGYPIRGSIALKSREEAFANLPFQVHNGQRVVFAFGGSQGARTINRAIVDALPGLIPHRDKIFIVHGMGLSKTADYDATADTESRIDASLTPEERSLLDSFYYRQDYFHNIADVYCVSDLIVCRSGAGSLNEISRLARPALLIPKANLPGDHQVMNARAMKHSGAAEILFEDTIVEKGEVLEKLEGRRLAERILRLLDDEPKLRAMEANSGHFLRRHAVERILSEVYGDNGYNNGAGRNGVPFKPLLGNGTLQQRLSAAYNKSPGDYDPLKVVDDEDDLIYYRHRAASLLSHKTWPDRNLGVKLVGLTKYREKIPTLLHMLADRTPAHWTRRCFGGDFRQVGFIRRNIVQAIQVLDCLDAEVEKGLLKALQDPYFEVRAQVCIAAAHFGPQLAGREEWLQAIGARLNDPCFEVVMEAAKALGEIGMDAAAAQVLLGFRESHYWQVRDAALTGVKRLLERGMVDSSPELLEQLSSFILTATDFRPYFSIKENYKNIRRCLDKRSAEANDSGPAAVVSQSPARKQ